MRTLCVLTGLFSILVSPAYTQGDVRVLATNKTSTMEKEMNEAAEAGYRFAGVMGGDTAFGGSEVVVLMTKNPGASSFGYRLLATSKTSTMQKEMQEAGDAGFEYKGQTIFKSTFGGKEVVVNSAETGSVRRSAPQATLSRSSGAPEQGIEQHVPGIQEWIRDRDATPGKPVLQVL